LQLGLCSLLFNSLVEIFLIQNVFCLPTALNTCAKAPLVANGIYGPRAQLSRAKAISRPAALNHQENKTFDSIRAVAAARAKPPHNDSAGRAWLPALLIIEL